MKRLWYSLLFEFVFNDALAGLLCGGGLVCFLVSVGGLILCSFICGFVCYCDLLLVFYLRMECPLCLFTCSVLLMVVWV